jgi:hypothetical protein
MVCERRIRRPNRPRCLAYRAEVWQLSRERNSTCPNRHDLFSESSWCSTG